MPKGKPDLEVIQRSYYEWIIWNVIFPLGVVLTTWVLGSISDDAHPIMRLFAGGDLLLFSAMVLIGVSTQIKMLRFRKTKEHSWLDSKIGHAQLMACLLLVTYGMTKIEGFRLASVLSSETPVPTRLVWFAVLNIVGTVSSLLLSINMFWSGIEKSLRSEDEVES